jgi:cation/acetate symporter
LPHILMRYFTTPSVREARVSVAWSLFFIFLLYFTAPAYAAFSKLEVYNTVIGRPLDDIRPWLLTYGQLSLIKVCGVDAVSIDAIKAACSNIAGHPGVIRLADFRIDQDVIVLSTPEIAGMPYVIAGLVAAGGLAAALSTADGLLLAIANALSHDLYYKTLDPKAPPRRRLLVARVLLLVVAVLSAYTASTRPADILAMVSWAFSLAAAGLFPALVMGIWWKRANSPGAVAGIISGFGVTLMYLIVTRYYPQFGIDYLGMYSNVNAVTGAPLVDIVKIAADPAQWNVSPVPASHALASKVGWFNVNNISSGLFGVPVGFVTIWIVSLLTPTPSSRVQELLDDIRRPRGETYLKEKTA